MPRPALLAALLLAGCATAPPPPPPPPLAVAPPPAPPRPTDEERLAEAARLVADGVALERAAALLADLPPGTPGLDLLAAQLGELRGDDAGAVLAYERVLAERDDPEVRLRRALALERLGRADEAAGDLRALRDAPARPPPDEERPQRSLRPLKPSSR